MGPDTQLQRISCPGCGMVGEWRRWPTSNAHRQCNNCFRVYSYKQLVKDAPKTRPKRSRGQRIAKKQELDLVSKREGARRHWGSGSDPRLKSDASEGDSVRYECKSTDDESIRLKKSDLLKIEGEALERGQIPVLQLRFAQRRRTQDELEYAVLRWTDFEILLDGVLGSSNENER